MIQEIPLLMCLLFLYVRLTFDVSRSNKEETKERNPKCYSFYKLDEGK